MNFTKFLFMLRPELVCMAALIFVQVYAYYYRKTTAKIFRSACWAAMAHMLFDMVTVVTVNSLDDVSPISNKCCHLLLYISALIFCQIHLDYIALLTLSTPAQKRLVLICRSLTALYAVTSPFMPISYTENEITNYSGGFSCYLLMGTAYLFFVITILFLFIRRKRIETYVFVVTLSTTLFMMAVVTAQLLIPTFLFSGCGITVVTLGMFFAIENPAKYYKERALIDISTGVKNRNCYVEDIKSLQKKCEEDEKNVLTIAICDMNWLKLVNDTYGHLEGDEYIRQAALLLSKEFQNMFSIYRFGGDEFVVLFLNRDKKEIDGEIKTIYQKCEEITKSSNKSFSLSLGYASTDESISRSITETFALADKRMYEEKKRMKESGQIRKPNAD